MLNKLLKRVLIIISIAHIIDVRSNLSGGGGGKFFYK